MGGGGGAKPQTMSSHSARQLSASPVLGVGLRSHAQLGEVQRQLGVREAQQRLEEPQVPPAGKKNGDGGFGDPGWWDVVGFVKMVAACLGLVDWLVGWLVGCFAKVHHAFPLGCNSY